MPEASLLVSYWFEPGNPYHDLPKEQKRSIDQKLMKKLLADFPVGMANGLMKVKLDDAYPDRTMLDSLVTKHLPVVQAAFKGGPLRLSDSGEWSARYVAIPPNEHRHYATLPLNLGGGSAGAQRAGVEIGKQPQARLDLDDSDKPEALQSMPSAAKERSDTRDDATTDSTPNGKPWTGARLVVSLSWNEEIPDTMLPIDGKLLRLERQVAELEARLKGAAPVDPFSFHNPHKKL